MSPRPARPPSSRPPAAPWPARASGCATGPARCCPGPTLPSSRRSSRPPTNPVLLPFPPRSTPTRCRLCLARSTTCPTPSSTTGCRCRPVRWATWWSTPRGPWSVPGRPRATFAPSAARLLPTSTPTAAFSRRVASRPYRRPARPTSSSSTTSTAAPAPGASRSSWAAGTPPVLPNIPRTPTAPWSSWGRASSWGMPPGPQACPWPRRSPSWPCGFSRATRESLLPR